MNETASLKSLASNILERLERNKSRNKHETNVPNRVSHLLHCETKYETQNSVYFLPNSIGTSLNYHSGILRDGYEERIAIAEMDGKQPPIEAHRIFYLGAFISILSDLAEKEPYRGWLAQKIQIGLETLEAHHLPAHH